MNDYYRTGEKIAVYLRKNQQPNGTLYDEVDGEKTPDNHYAHTFFGLSSILLYKNTKEKHWLDIGKKTINYYLSIKEKNRGHREFNNLAVLLIYQDMVKLHPGKELVKRLEKYIRNMGFDSDIEDNMSNNWFLMKAVCCALKYHIFNSMEEKTKAENIVDNHILKCQTDDGLFYDWPNRPDARSFAAPLAYHAKMCSMLLLYHDFIKNSNAFKAAVKGLDALKHFIADDGETFYYGRSNNALFGYVSGIYAYEKAAQLSPMRSEEFKFYANKLFGFMEKWRQEDGYISIAPNKFEKEKCGWDEYMHLTVYNAYAAAFLLMLSDVKRKGVYTKVSQETYHTENSGLLTIRNDNLFMCLSTKGQSVARGTMFSDPRYYGMNILCMKYRGIDIISPPPLIKTSLRDMLNPSLTGFLPYVIDDNKIYSPRVYDKISIENNSDVMKIFAEGKLTAYEPKFIYELVKGRRIFDYLYHKLINKKKIWYDIEKLDEIAFYRSIIVLPKEPIILFIDSLDFLNTKDKKIMFSTLSCRINSEDMNIDKKRIIGKEKIDVIVETLSDNMNDPSKVLVPTSKGYSYVVNNVNIIDWGNPYTLVFALYLDDHKSQIPEFKTMIKGMHDVEVEINTENNKYRTDISKR